MKTVKPIPAGYHTATPYLIIKGAADAIAYYQKAFGAIEKMRINGPDGQVGHAELLIGDSHIMLGEECPQRGASAPHTLGGSAVGICLYVEDVDAVFQRAVDAGGTVKMPVVDQVYGDRSGTVVDPFGHVWTIATHKEDLTAAEVEARCADWMKKAAAG